MSSTSDDDKWKDVEDHFAKKQRANNLPQPAKNSPVPSVLSGAPERPQGIIEKFQTNGIERRKRIEFLTAKAKAQVEAWKHNLEGQLTVAKSRIDLHVEVELMEIGEQHLENLREVGIANHEGRSRAMRELSEKTARQLEQAMQMDVPPTMKKRVVDAITSDWEKLLDKIASDEIRPSAKTE